MPENTDRAFLIAVKQPLEETIVFAVRTASQDDAMRLVAGLAPPSAALELVGHLSPKTVQKLRLKAGEALPV